MNSASRRCDRADRTVPTCASAPVGHHRPAGRRSSLSGLALLAVLSVLAAACGGGVGATTDAAPTMLDASQPFGGDPTAEGQPVRGGTLRVGMYTEARSFDPTIGSNLIASAV